MVQVILKKDVDDLGEAGDLVDVRPGYARNYLLPQGFAFEATEANVRRIDEERRQAARSSERARERARDRAERLAAHSVTFRMRAAEEGRLFGSVTTADIGAALERDGLPVDRHLIELDEPLKQLGVYKVGIRLHPDVRPEVTVWVVAAE